MAQPQRNDVDQRGPAFPQQAPDRHYDAGGHIAQLQAELAQRLAGGTVDPQPIASRSGERAVRFVSITGGYLALGAGYAVAAFALFRLI